MKAPEVRLSSKGTFMPILSKVSSLLKDRRGNVAMMAALLMVPLTVISGGAVDFMLHERLRSSFQNDLGAPWAFLH